ncbi:MAG TPA: hypothetical protein VFA30_00530 [Gaiellaceae bacterium]|nr:hypothetical protein [Gaiellaceae bacterium]
MTIRALLLVLAALVAAPAALADGGIVPAAQLGPGIVSPDGGTRYIAAPNGSNTSLLAISTKDGEVTQDAPVDGSYGIPLLAASPQTYAGLSTDGRTLVLADTQLLADSHFLVYDTKTFRMKDAFFLKGSFAYDAMSPDGSMLYLIEHPYSNDLQHYIVRAYDLRTDRLLSGRIADRTQKSWVMEGTALTRVTSPGGRYVYTLYENPGGYPFVHALDTVRGVAHCIGLPWTNLTNQTALWNVVLSVHGSRLAVGWRSGRRWLSIDTRTWSVSPDRRGGFPWLWLGVGLAAAAALAGAVRPLLRRRGTRRAAPSGAPARAT